MKVCLACGGGGHLTEIMQLSSLYQKYEHFFITVKGEDTIHLKEKERVYFVINPLRSPYKFLLCVFQSFIIFLKERPPVIITTGPGAAIPICYFARLGGKKIIFIETFTRVLVPSLFGKLIYPISNLSIVQWKPLLKYYKKAIYGGPIFDFNGENEEFTTKYPFFITVGTWKGGFDRLLKKIDDLVRKGLIKGNILAQIGHSEYIPTNYQWFRFVSPPELIDIIKKSKIIITHDGAGSIGSSLRFGKTIIVAPRFKKFKETGYENPLDFAKELEKQGKVIIAYDMEDMEKALVKAETFKPDWSSGSKIKKIIENYLTREIKNHNENRLLR